MNFLRDLFNAIPAKLGISFLIAASLSGCLNVGGGGASSGGGIAITPDSSQVATGAPISYSATRTYGDGSTADITGKVTWSSSNKAIATISSAGVATGVAVGNTTITASMDGVSSNGAALKVTAAFPITIPTTASVGVGLTTAISALKTNPDNSTSAISSQVTWTSSNNAIATVASNGVVTGVAAGTATITASQYGVTSNTTTVTVTPWTITLSPAAGTVYVGTTTSFTATRNNADLTTSDITSQVTWSSSNTTFATISAAGVATGVATGTTTITATLSGITGTASLTVATADPMTGSSWTTGSYWSVVTDATVPNNASVPVLKASGVSSYYYTTVASKFVNLASSGNVSFYQQLVCGYNCGTYYDNLAFAIDGVVQNTQTTASAWTKLTYPITAGAHTLSWSYYTYSPYYSGSAAISQVQLPSLKSTAVVGTQQGGARQGTTLALATSVTTLAGTGSAGAVDATGTAASFSTPVCITTDGSNLYVVDHTNNKIRKIVIATGVVTTLAGSGSLGSVDSTTGTLASFSSPYGITTDGTNLYVGDTSSQKIRKIVIATGVVTTLAGSGGVGSVDSTTGTLATFYNPGGITTDGTNLYVADMSNYKIRKIVIATGAVTTLAGSGGLGSADNATGTLATFYNPTSLTTDGSNLYVADTYNNKIRKIVIATGAVTTLAGSGAYSSIDNATGTLATFTYPQGITTDGSNLYVADTYGNKIRKIALSGTNAVTTVAGSGTASSTDNSTGTLATFNSPFGITTDGVKLYVADMYGNKIRQIQ